MLFGKKHTYPEYTPNRCDTMALPPHQRVELGALYPVWRRNNYPQWSGTRPVDGKPPGAGHAGPDVAHAAGPRPSRGALGAGDAATAPGHPGAPRPPVTAW